ncbi:hypothetical protein Arub01_43300 [Actinomadura rubrobrunea]|uniref:Uncharacterized protein n=1 Tax=Actinomadura rubrobrunea TaxID=115335 RepID=A0A9W6PZN7_9ACTN|nr:hypothetical protein Arub01_43300 [Actinomadura rubrobrunea]
MDTGGADTAARMTRRMTRSELLDAADEPRPDGVAQVRRRRRGGPAGRGSKSSGNAQHDFAPCRLALHRGLRGGQGVGAEPGRAMRRSRGQEKAFCPVRARPTTREWISDVPS